MWVTHLVPEISYGSESISMAAAYDQKIEITRSYPKRNFVQSYDGSSFFDMNNMMPALGIAEFSFTFTMRVTGKTYDSTAATLKKYVHGNLFLMGKRDSNAANANVVLKTVVSRLREERQFGKVKWTIEGTCLPFWYDQSLTSHWTPMTSGSAINSYSFTWSGLTYSGDVFNVYDDFCQAEIVASAGTHSYFGLWWLPSYNNNNINGATGGEKTNSYGGPSGTGPACSYPTNKMTIKPTSLIIRNNTTDAFVSDETKYLVRSAEAGLANYTNKFFGLFKGVQPYMAHVFSGNIATTLNATVRFRNLWW
jgi:hypothetical protein